MGKRLERILVIAIVLLYQLSFSQIASAGFFDWLVSKEDNDTLVSTNVPKIENEFYFDKFFAWDNRQTENINKEILIPEKKEIPEIKIIKTHVVRATGYSSTPDQTDDSPFITASGSHVRDGIIAANFYMNGQRVPFGTRVRIPEIYGDKIFIVEDRMNARYTNNIDIWFPERSLARSFGSKRVTIEIVQEFQES